MGWKDEMPGEWQIEVNQWGGKRRYRMNGNIKEYEPEIMIDGIPIPESEIEAYNARKKAAIDAMVEAQKRELTQRRATCPFLQSFDRGCLRDKCAMYLNGCTLSQAKAAARNTAGLRCPFTSGSCQTDCTFYKGGCTLTAAERI